MKVVTEKVIEFPRSEYIARYGACCARDKREQLATRNVAGLTRYLSGQKGNLLVEDEEHKKA